MAELSRCGRRYEFADALKAAELKSYKSGNQWKAITCAHGDHWHVVLPAAAKLDPFPPVVARQLDARDEHCQRCGRGGRLERHHRRGKHSGGSKGRAHTQCACNGLRLCRACHAWVHANSGEAKDHGWIVRQAEPFPYRRGVTRCIDVEYALPGSLGTHPVLDPQWATCDGRWVHSPQEAES